MAKQLLREELLALVNSPLAASLTAARSSRRPLLVIAASRCSRRLRSTVLTSNCASGTGVSPAASRPTPAHAQPTPISQCYSGRSTLSCGVYPW